MDFTKLIAQASDFVWGLIEEKVTERLNAKAEEIEKKALQGNAVLTEGEVIDIFRAEMEYGTRIEEKLREYLEYNDYEPVGSYSFDNAIENAVSDALSDCLTDDVQRIVKEMVADGEFTINAEITLDTM